MTATHVFLGLGAGARGLPRVTEMFCVLIVAVTWCIVLLKLIELSALNGCTLLHVSYP